jgi:F-type H+-transporting ATPase subunit b
MEQTLRQVGELLLGAVPTVLLLLLLYGCFSALVYKPLQKTLAERRSRTVGAIEKARADIAVAEAKTLEYEAKLREARLAIFRAQEARRNQAQQARAEVVAAAREQADSLIREAKAEIGGEAAAAKQGLQAEAARLAEAIIRAILQPAGKSGAPAAGRQ